MKDGRMNDLIVRDARPLNRLIGNLELTQSARGQEQIEELRRRRELEALPGRRFDLGLERRVFDELRQAAEGFLDVCAREASVLHVGLEQSDDRHLVVDRAQQLADAVDGGEVAVGDKDEHGLGLVHILLAAALLCTRGIEGSR